MKKYYYKKFKFKQLLRVREPIHENLRILNFKRPKWSFLKKIYASKFSKTFLLKKFYNKKIKPNFYYPMGYSIPNRWINLRFNYKEKLLSKTKLALFYGITKIKKNSNFLSNLETRLDIFLWRANFFKSPGIARFYINHKNVFINTKCVNLYQKQLNIGDILTFSKNIQTQVKNSYLLINKSKTEKFEIKKKVLNNLFPFYLELNGDILALSFFTKISEYDISQLVYLYPTALNIEKIYTYFK